MLTTKEISKKLKVSEETVRRWIRKEDLHATQEGKSYLVEEDDLEEFIKKMSQNTSTSIGKLFTLSAVAGAAIAQKPSPKDIVSKVFSKINENKHEFKKDKSSVSDIEMYIEELRHKRKKRELEHQMELLEIDRDVAKYEKILEQLKKEM